jgi:hypothetical protein
MTIAIQELRIAMIAFCSLCIDVACPAQSIETHTIIHADGMRPEDLDAQLSNAPDQATIELRGKAYDVGEWRARMANAVAEWQRVAADHDAKERAAIARDQKEFADREQQRLANSKAEAMVRFRQLNGSIPPHCARQHKLRTQMSALIDKVAVAPPSELANLTQQAAKIIQQYSMLSAEPQSGTPKPPETTGPRK